MGLGPPKAFSSLAFYSMLLLSAIRLTDATLYSRLLMLVSCMLNIPVPFKHKMKYVPQFHFKDTSSIVSKSKESK